MRLEEIAAKLESAVIWLERTCKHPNQCDGMSDAIAELRRLARSAPLATPSGGVYPYEVHYNTGDSRAGFTSFTDAVAFYRAKRPYSTIVGKDFDGELDGLTDEERERVQEA